MANAIVAQHNLIGNPSRLSLQKIGLIYWLTGNGDPFVAAGVVCAAPIF